MPKTWSRFASRLAPAIAWRLGVDRVITSSSSLPMMARAIVFDVAVSPSALYRWTEIVRPSWYPDAASPASTPRTPSSMVACETCWNNAIERVRGGPRACRRRSHAARALPVGQEQHGGCRQDQGHSEP